MARKKKVQQKQPRDLTEQEAEYLRNRLDGMEPKAAFVAATPNSDGQKNIPQRAAALEKRLRVKEVIEKVNREILAPIVRPEIEIIDKPPTEETDRNTNGFGSTGK